MLDTGLIRSHALNYVRADRPDNAPVACMAMIAEALGRESTYDELLLLANFREVSGLELVHFLAAKLDLVPVLASDIAAVSSSQGPSLLWTSDGTSYLVLSANSKMARIYDPLTMGVSERDSHSIFDREAILVRFERIQSFQKTEKPARLKISEMIPDLRGMYAAAAQTVLLTLVLQAYILASPYYMQLAVDQVIPSGDSGLLLVLALGFGLFACVNVVATLLRAFVISAVGAVLGYNLTSGLASRLFRLPIDYFGKREVGDILSRFQSVGAVNNWLTQGALTVVIDGSVVIFTFIIMMWYSVSLAMLALLAFLLYGLTRILYFRVERRAQERAIATKGREQTSLIETIRGIATVRLFDIEQKRHSSWSDKLRNATNASVDARRIANWQAAANQAIFGLESVVAVWMAVQFVLEGSGFSIGMIFAYMAYKGQFLQRAGGLIDQAIALKMLGLHLERMSDIGLHEPDPSFSEAPRRKRELEGAVSLKGVRFAYGNSDRAILDGIDLDVSPGEHLAIAGPSGGGKTTLVKILSGLLAPASGAILVDGIPIEEFGITNFRSQIAVVMQEDNLFAGTLFENIAMFDNRADEGRVREAARLAAIHDDIMQMPAEYNTLIGDMGSTLSGGEKQRILIARAIFRRPRLLLMDEATAHLDPEKERQVNLSIAELGVTRIVIAHREETISAAQRVLLLKDGLLTSP